jgi:iron uptake system component EfeO
VLLSTLTLAAALALAACGGTQPATSGPGASTPAGTVNVEAKEYAFTPSTITVPAGEVTFQVKNAGTEEHEFELFNADGTTVIDEIEGLVPGLTKTLTVPAEKVPPGEYLFMCKLNGHDQLGMKGTLTVS